MKILQIIPAFDFGGAEIMCETLSYELAKNNNIKVVSLYSTETDITRRMQKRSIDLVFLGKKRGFDFKCVSKLKRIIRLFKPDIIHTHLYALKYAVLATLGSKIKIVHTIHNMADKEASKVDRVFNGFFYRNKRVMPVALNGVVCESIKNEYHLKKIAIPVVFNGSDFSRLCSKRSYEKTGKFKFINVARFSPQKNHRRLIDAFYLLVREFPNCELHLVGDGELRPAVEEKVDLMHLSGMVFFHGTQNDVLAHLLKSDCFVLSSDYEGAPITLIEAMATGLPIVATDVGGVSEMIKDGVDGCLVEPDVKSIYSAMRKVYLDDSFRESIGRSALKKSALFSSSSMAGGYLDLYRSASIDGNNS